MAAQEKAHTPNQLIGLSRKHPCSACKKQLSSVIESRKTTDATRRRFRCEGCGHRETRYEINEEAYKEYKKLKECFTAFENILSKSERAETVKTVPCLNCVHYVNSGCSFGFPEEGTYAAIDCSMLEVV